MRIGCLGWTIIAILAIGGAMGVVDWISGWGEERVALTGSVTVPDRCDGPRSLAVAGEVVGLGDGIPDGSGCRYALDADVPMRDVYTFSTRGLPDVTVRASQIDTRDDDGASVLRVRLSWP